jgi:hypothetical protein
MTATPLFALTVYTVVARSICEAHDGILLASKFKPRLNVVNYINDDRLCR